MVIVEPEARIHNFFQYENITEQLQQFNFQIRVLFTKVRLHSSEYGNENVVKTLRKSGSFLILLT
jgi:hypothetical protein